MLANEIKQKVCIVEHAERMLGMSLKRTGNSYREIGNDSLAIYPGSGWGLGWAIDYAARDMLDGTVIDLDIYKRGGTAADAIRRIAAEWGLKSDTTTAPPQQLARPTDTPPQPKPERIRASDSDAWQTRARAFIDYGLKGSAKAHEYLAQRGISSALAEKFNIGWYRHSDDPHKWMVDQWGEKEVKLPPGGLVIPWELDGHIYNLQVRPDPPIPNMGKYISAGGVDTSRLFLTGPVTPETTVVLVEGVIDALSIAMLDMPSIVGAATGSTSWGRSDWAKTLLSTARRVLVAYDDEPNPNTWAAIAYWLGILGNVSRLAPSGGKDPNDILTSSGTATLKSWLTSTGVLLPEKARVTPNMSQTTQKTPSAAPAPLKCAQSAIPAAQQTSEEIEIEHNIKPVSPETTEQPKTIASADVSQQTIEQPKSIALVNVSRSVWPVTLTWHYAFQIPVSATDYVVIAQDAKTAALLFAHSDFIATPGWYIFNAEHMTQKQIAALAEHVSGACVVFLAFDNSSAGQASAQTWRAALAEEWDSAEAGLLVDLCPPDGMTSLDDMTKQKDAIDEHIISAWDAASNEHSADEKFDTSSEDVTA